MHGYNTLFYLDKEQQVERPIFHEEVDLLLGHQHA